VKQVDRDHYAFEQYTSLERWSAYYYQIREILALAPASVLEIGTGDGFLRRYLEGATSIEYRSVDVASDLKPDIVASAESLPIVDGAVDVVVAFEVLEHLPFDRFEPALREMARVTRRHVLISLPHAGPRPKLALKLPRVKELRVAFKVSLPTRHVFRGEHYWEIGRQGYSLATVRAVMRRVLSLEKDFIPFESQYQHFFLLKK